MMMDVSAVTGNSNIGGISQPIIGQRKIEHEIRLKEGEVNLLGGIFENQDVKSLSGLPGLAQVPLLKYLFSSTNVEHKENEIVFVLIPHIVGGQELSDLTERTIEVGTGNAIGLRRAVHPAPAAGAGGSAMTGPPPAVQPMPAPAAAASTPAPDAAPAGSSPTATAFMMD